MTTVHSPTAGRRRLRLALKEARDAASLTQEQVATAMDWSLSKVIRIETGGVSVSTSDLRQLLLLYHVDDPDEVDRLVELARVGRRKPWWTRFKDHVPPGYLSFIGLEDESSAQFCFTPQGLPGLLQTRAFAQAVVDAVVPSIHTLSQPPQTRPAPELSADRVDIRMIRQREILDRENPPEILTVLDEAVIRRQIGGAAVLKEQLLHLLAIASRPHLTIQVLPFSAQMATALGHFIILRFPDSADTDVVYVENAFDQSILDRPAEVAAYQVAFDRLRSAALAEKESLELIARVADELS